MSAPQFSKLNERIQACNLKDVQEHAAIREELTELREVLLRISSVELAGCVDAAVTLTGYMSELPSTAGEGLRQIVSRLVAVVASSLAQMKQTQAPAARMRKLTSPAESERSESLRLINDMMLGEILIQLGVVNREKVDAAIKTQHATNMRFGEALVHLGAASWEDVENGLRLQESVAKTRLGENAPAHLGLGGGKDRPPVSAFGSEHLNVLNDMMLGEEMIRLGTISREQLQEALRVQHAAGIRIGEALVEVGAATWDQVAEGVRMQGRHRDQGGGHSKRSVAL